MDMNSKLFHDEETNIVYLSPWLKDKKEGHPEFYQRLKYVFNGMGIESKELKCTNDYWARDYMPIQLGKNDFLKYHYYPDYLINKDDIDSITDVSKVISGMGIHYRSTNLIIDGGNMVSCGPYIVMTNKVFSENRKRKMMQTLRLYWNQSLVILLSFTLPCFFTGRLAETSIDTNIV